MIKLLALDLDGTLLNSRGEISAANREAIRLAEDRGVLVTIATGRRFRDARPVALDLNLNAPVISHNGALLKFAETLEIVAASLLEKNTLREILRVGREFDADAMLSADPKGKGVLLYDRISEENVALQKYLTWSKYLHGTEADESVRHVDSLEAVLHEYETVHVSFSGTCSQMKDLVSLLEGELQARVKVLSTVYSSRDFTLIDILPPDASKGTGVEKLATRNQISRENVLAIGDNFNDLEMLEFAGTSVVMGNASPELLEDSHFETTLSNDQDGVALAIERFILQS